MSEVGPFDVSMHWATPVVIQLEQTGLLSVDGPEDALHLLSDRWPMTCGSHYQVARQTCMAALERCGSSNVAREAFVGACNEANLLAPSPTVRN